MIRLMAEVILPTVLVVACRCTAANCCMFWVVARLCLGKKRLVIYRLLWVGSSGKRTLVVNILQRQQTVALVGRARVVIVAAVNSTLSRVSWLKGIKVFVSTLFNFSFIVRVIQLGPVSVTVAFSIYLVRYLLPLWLVWVKYSMNSMVTL